MQQYIGKVAQLIYNDSKGKVTIREVRVLVVGDQQVMAYCYQARSVRTFKISGIVDIELLNPKALEVMQHARRHIAQSAAHTV